MNNIKNLTIKQITEVMLDKEKWDVYRKFLQIESSVDESSQLYNFFDMFSDMLLNERSYIRVRAFRIICKLAKWDSDNKINVIIDNLLNILDDDKPTNIRLCLSSLHNVLLYKKELGNKIKNKLNKIDCSNFKDSMRPLIEKDIEKILEKI